MPKLLSANPKIVYCANCRKSHVDQGQRQTCEQCGCSPLPSYSYPKDSAFYPKPRRLYADQLPYQPDFLQHLEEKKRKLKQIREKKGKS